MQQFNKNQIIAITLSICLIGASGCSIDSKRLKQIGTIVAVGIAAKLIYDMVVEYQTKKTTSEDEVIDRYVKEHSRLPAEPVLVTYESSIKPGEVVTAGNDVSIQSKLEVVRSESSRLVDIQEKITIYDNEDHSKELKSLTKSVNQESRTSGSFENEFTFKLPKGMPQGIYPVKTQVIVDGKTYEPVNAQMQLVNFEEVNNREQLVAAN